MSDVTSIFFNALGDIGDCRSSIEELLGITFIEKKDDGIHRYIITCFGLELILFDNHGLVNDMGIRFEDFAYELDLLIVKNGIKADVTLTFRLASARFLFELITTQFKWNSILVDNFQRVVAFFPEGDAAIRN